MDAIKRSRLRTPKVITCTAGSADGAAFEAHLIEDDAHAHAPTPGSLARGGFTYEHFLEFQRAEVEAHLKAMGATRTRSTVSHPGRPVSPSPAPPSPAGRLSGLACPCTAPSTRVAAPYGSSRTVVATIIQGSILHIL